MGGQRKIESGAQGIDIRAHIGTCAARILFLWCIARRALVANEKECTSSVGCCLCISQVNQYGCTVGHDADIIRFDIAMNNYRLLGMKELDCITH